MRMIAGVKKQDLISSYIEKFHNKESILVIHMNDSEGCKSILKQIDEELMLPVPNRIEMDSDFLLLGTYTREAVELIKKNNHLVSDTHLELYVNGSLYIRN